MSLVDPLRRLVHAQQDERDPYRRAWRLIDVFEWAVKWETAIVLGRALDRLELPASLRLHLARGLQRPSLGHWMQILHQTLELERPDDPFRTWDRVRRLDNKHQLARFRNEYAHGAVERDDQARARCERFEPVVEELLASPFFTDVGLLVVAPEHRRHLGGPEPSGPAGDLTDTAPGTYAWVAGTETLVWVWPLAAHLSDPDGGQSGLYFHNALRASSVEALNYELPDQVRRRDLLTRFYDRVPLDRWQQAADPELDPYRPLLAALTDGFVGRDRDLDELLTRTLQDHPEQVLFGPPGQGKSALLAALVDRLRHERSETVVVIETFLRRGDALSGEVAVLRSWVTRIARLLGRRIDPTTRVVELAEQLRTLLVRWERDGDRLLVLVVDGLDEQPALLDLLPAPSERVRLVWSARPIQQAHETALHRHVPVRARDVVGSLDAAATRAVLYRGVDKLDPRLTPAFVAAVRERSGGNPLFITALADLLFDRPELVGDLALLPSEVAEMFDDAADRATDGGRDEVAIDVLHLLAVAEDLLHASEIADLVGIRSARVRRAIGDVGELLIADPVGHPRPRFGLFHASVRTWFAETEPDELLRLHDRLAERFADPSDQRAGRTYLLEHGITHLTEVVSGHPRRGRQLVERALRTLLLPGEAAGRTTDVDPMRSVGDLARVHDLGVATGLDPGAELAEVAVALVRGTTDPSEAGPPAGTTRRLAPGVLHDGLMYRTPEGFTEAVYTTIEAVATHDDPIDLELRVLVAGRLRRRGTHDERRRARGLLVGVDEAGSLPDRVAARAAYERAYLDHLEDVPRLAIDGMDRSAELADRAGDHTGAWISRCVAAQLRYLDGTLGATDYDELLQQAGSWFTSAEVEDTAASRWVTNVAAHRCDLALDEGDQDLARHMFEQLAHHPWVVDTGRAAQLEVRRRRLAIHGGRCDEVVEDLRRELHEREQARPVREGRALEHLDLARALIGVERPEEARRTAEAGLDAPPGCATWPWLERLREVARPPL